VPVVGIAEVLVRPSFRGAQRTIAKEMTGAADSAGDSAGKSAGAKMGASLGKALKTGALAAGAAVTGVLGTAIVKGFNRLSAIEQAKAKLAGLGNSAKDVTAIMDNAMAAVKGTAFGMDEAATVAASAVAAGIKPGKELEKTLKLVGDAATIGGTSMGEMGAIFNKVAASNKLQGDSIAQLQDRGIPILQLLGKSLGKTSSEVADMASKGKIDFATFQKAMEAGLGGAALKSGNTTVGAFKNMNAALSRFGAALLQDIFPLVGPLFNRITAGIDSATKSVKPFVALVMEGFNGIYALLVKGDFTSAFAKVFKVQEDSKLVDYLFTVRDSIHNFIAGVKGDVSAADFARITEGPLKTFALLGAGLRDAVRTIWDAVKPLAPQIITLASAFSPLGLLLKVIAPILPQLGDLFAALGTALADSLVALLPSVTSLVSELVTVFVQSLVPIMPNVVGLLGLVGDVVMVLAPQLADFLSTLLPLVSGVLTTAIQTVAGFLSGVLDMIMNIPGGVDTITTAFVAVAAAVLTYKTVMGAITIATNLFATAQKVAAVAVRIFNAAMKANVVGLVIAAIAALVAGLVWFFTQTELGKQIVANVWGFIQSAIKAVGDWFTGTLVPAFQAAVQWVGDAFNWLYTNVIQPVFNGIATVFTWWWTNVTQPIFNAVMSVVQAVGGFFSWLYNDILSPVFQLIGALFAWWWNNITMPIFNAVVGFVRDTLGAIFTWFYSSVIKPVFDAIGAAISWVSTYVISPIVTAWNLWFGTILPGIFNWLYSNVVKPVFDAIGGAINWVWQNVILPVFNAIQSTINVVGSVIGWLYQNVVKPQFDAIGSAIKWVWENVIKPVFDFLSDTIQKKIPDAFEKGKKFIEDIWKGIQEVVKAPIRFVIQTVLNDGLIGAFNTVAGFLGTKKLGLIDLPKGFSDGGYTGPGGKYTPAGIVHAGEVVWSQADIARWGGVGVVEALRKARGYAAGGLVSPLDSWALTQAYGPAHNGLDMAAPLGTPIHAAGPGRVSFAGWGANNQGGNEMHIDHPNGLQTWYAHQSAFAAHLGDMVRQGQTIGYVGQTGQATGPHLHYMVLDGGWPNVMDPTPYLTGGGAAGSGKGGGFMNPIAGIIDGLIGQFKKAFPQGGFVVDLVGDFAKNLLNTASDAVMTLFGKRTDDGAKGNAEGIPHLFRDQGGALPEGLSMVLNRTGSPEWVFNRDQLSTLNGAVTRGGNGVEVNIHGNVGYDPHELANRIDTKRRDSLALEGIY
jgi:tape measure domain-containing protein